MYKKNGQLYSRSAALVEILTSLDTVIEPAYVDDDTFAAFGYALVILTTTPTSTKECRKEVLTATDWISTAEHITPDTKKRYESWRWLIRNMPSIPELRSIPPTPAPEAVGIFDTLKLSDKDTEKIKNYVCEDVGWITFLEVWKNTSFTNVKTVIYHLLTSYTAVQLDEIIGSL